MFLIFPILAVVRTAFSTFLLSIVLISIVGHFPFFKIRQHIIQRTVRERISGRHRSKSLTLISVPSSRQQELVWEKPGKEFRYKGNMYDVLHSRRQGSDILYYCYKDDEETTLINRLNETIAKDRERSGAVGGAYKVILNLFATALPLLHDYQYPTSYLKTIFCFADYPDYFSKGFGRLNSPPPDFTA